MVSLMGIQGGGQIRAPHACLPPGEGAALEPHGLPWLRKQQGIPDSSGLCSWKKAAYYRSPAFYWLCDLEAYDSTSLGLGFLIHKTERVTVSKQQDCSAEE